MDEVKDRGHSVTTWLGWLGIVSAIVAFFYAPFLFGGAAVILGVINIFSRNRSSVGWWAVILGILGAFLNVITHGVRLW